MTGTKKPQTTAWLQRGWIRNGLALVLASATVGYAATAAAQDEFVQDDNKLLTSKVASAFFAEPNKRCVNVFVNDVEEANFSFGNKNPPIRNEDDDGFTGDDQPSFADANLKTIIGSDGKQLQFMIDVFDTTTGVKVPRVTGFRIDPSDFNNDISDNIVAYITKFDDGSSQINILTGVGLDGVKVLSQDLVLSSENELKDDFPNDLADAPSITDISFCYGVPNFVVGEFVLLQAPQQCDTTGELELNGVIPTFDGDARRLVLVIDLDDIGGGGGIVGGNPEACTFNTTFVDCDEENFDPADPDAPDSTCTPSGPLRGLPTVFEIFLGDGSVTGAFCTYIGGKRICFEEDAFK